MHNSTVHSTIVTVTIARATFTSWYLFLHNNYYHQYWMIARCHVHLSHAISWVSCYQPRAQAPPSSGRQWSGWESHSSDPWQCVGGGSVDHRATLVQLMSPRRDWVSLYNRGLSHLEGSHWEGVGTDVTTPTCQYITYVSPSSTGRATSPTHSPERGSQHSTVPCVCVCVLVSYM